MKFLRYLQKKRRAMLAMAALTFFAAPLAAQASTITTKDGKTLTPKNKVYNIEVQKKLSEQVGVNKFKDFTLDKGHIANMQFNKLQTLANLVDNKININGTVNALRDGKIGGNLYFLSPNGIAVGKTGVINAPGGINLYGTKIDVGKKAIMRTNVENIDFSKVINIMNGDKVKVDSGITGGLDASYSEGGIVLRGHAQHIADDNMLTNLSGDTATRWVEDASREAIINVDGTVKSAGGVTISADSTISFSEGSYTYVTHDKEDKYKKEPDRKSCRRPNYQCHCNNRRRRHELQRNG